MWGVLGKERLGADHSVTPSPCSVVISYYHRPSPHTLLMCYVYATRTNNSCFLNSSKTYCLSIFFLLHSWVPLKVAGHSSALRWSLPECQAPIF